MESVPDDLLTYLRQLVSPPDGVAPVVVVERSGAEVPWDTFAASSVHALVLVGDVRPYLDAIDRVLRPGALVLVISDESDCTGATVACAFEEAGYEVRDTICIPERPGELHYLPKAAKKERNAGVLERHQETVTQRLFPRSAEDAVELRDELSESLPADDLWDMELCGLPVSAVDDELVDRFEVREVTVSRVVKNHHPTVKSVALMRQLLQGVPPGGVVCDPFMGSGTTGVACVHTGHAFVGIEREEDYLSIADQRVRHANAGRVRADAEVVSEAAPPPVSRVTLDEFFGG